LALDRDGAAHAVQCNAHRSADLFRRTHPMAAGGDSTFNRDVYLEGAGRHARMAAKAARLQREARPRGKRKATRPRMR